MKTLLVVSLISVSSLCWAAEPIVHNGVEGVFIETKAAEELLKQVHIDLPAEQRKNTLLESEVQSLKALQVITKKQIDVESKIAANWEKAYESAMKTVAEEKTSDDIRPYVYAGVFVGGTILGAAVMYVSSLLLNNLQD